MFSFTNAYFPRQKGPLSLHYFALSLASQATAGPCLKPLLQWLWHQLWPNISHKNNHRKSPMKTWDPFIGTIQKTAQLNEYINKTLRNFISSSVRIGLTFTWKHQIIQFQIIEERLILISRIYWLHFIPWIHYTVHKRIHDMEIYIYI